MSRVIQQIRHCLFIVIVLYVNIGIVTSVVKYENDSAGLTEFPDDIPFNVEEIHLNDNNINAFDLSYFPALIYLNLDHNKLVEFPDLENVNRTLEFVSLYNNDIISMMKLPPMSALRYLSLDSNYLTHFPDVTFAAGTMKKLFVSSNSISFIPNHLVEPLIKLEYLKISHNILTSLPNFCIMGPTALAVKASGNPFFCDWKMGYAKSAEVLMKIEFLDEVTCDVPASLSGVPWTGITLQNLVREGTFIRNLHKLLS